MYLRRRCLERVGYTADDIRRHSSVSWPRPRAVSNSKGGLPIPLVSDNPDNATRRVLAPGWPASRVDDTDSPTVNVRRQRMETSRLREGYGARAATTATPISLVTLKSDPMGSQKNSTKTRLPMQEITRRERQVQPAAMLQGTLPLRTRASGSRYPVDSDRRTVSRDVGTGGDASRPPSPSVGLIEWLRGTKGPASVAKLSEFEAIQIAQTAAAPNSDAPALTLATRAVKDGRIVWSVSEAAIGNVLVVEVDDETSNVVSVRRVGLR